MSLSKLVSISNRYGRDEEYILAGGGNTSYKEGGVMYVKGSGAALADIRPEQFVRMDMHALSDMLGKKYPLQDAQREAMALNDMMAARLEGEEHKRPSVEAVLHALFPQKFVVHTHPALVNGMSCAKNGERACRDIFEDTVLWIPLTKPGYILAKVCRDLFSQYEKSVGKLPGVVILQNHGMFVAADTIDEIIAQTDEVICKLKGQITRFPGFADVSCGKGAPDVIATRLSALYGKDARVVLCRDAQVVEFLADEQFIKELIAPFTPDHIVYCKHTPLVLEQDSHIEEKFGGYLSAHGFAPKIVIVMGVGFFALGSNQKEAETARALFIDAMKIVVYARAFGGTSPLPDDFTYFILNWEAEMYRQKTSLVAE